MPTTHRGASPHVLTRQDLLDAIADLKEQLLDPDKPSLLSTLNAHIQRVERIAIDQGIHAQNFVNFQTQYVSDKARVKGWLLGAGAVGGLVVGAFKLLFH